MNDDAAPADPAWDPDPPADALRFDTLRQHGIDMAQRVSGKVWTDYNLHDPGVTLLEQTAFALSEVAYIGDHAVRDLLTRPIAPDEAGDPPAFDAEALALFGPHEVLPGRPVTLRDLGRRLSDLPGIDRVFVRPAPAPGHVDLMVLPFESLDDDSNGDSGGDSPETLIARVNAAFDQERLVTMARERTGLAERRPVLIEGDIEIDPLADPDRVAAGFFHRIGTVLHGHIASGMAGEPGRGHDRDAVFEDPARVWPDVAAGEVPGRDEQALLKAVRDIDGVLGVRGLRVIDSVTGKPVRPRDLPFGVYAHPRLPDRHMPLGLHLSSDGVPRHVDIHRLRQELRRLTASEITRRGNRLDAADWAVLHPGQARSFTPAAIDETLPIVYRAQPRQTARGGLARYREMIGTHLSDMTATLASLPDRFAARAAVDVLDSTGLAERIEMLDYLIALQGETMPDPPKEAIHAYRSRAESTLWAVDWREGYLARLAGFNRYQGSAHPDFGLAARLAHLCDLPVTGAPADPLAESAPILPDPGCTAPPPDVDVSSREAPFQPADMLIRRDPEARGYAPGELAGYCPFVAEDGTVDPVLMARAADPDAYLTLRDRDGDWQLLFDPGHGAMVHDLGSDRDREATVAHANRLRAGWAALNAAAESLTLIEDHQMRAAGDTRPGLAHLVIPGFTARTGAPGFRRFVTAQIERLAPAHVLVRPLWASPAQCAAIARAMARPADDAARATALRAVLETGPGDG